MLLGLALPGSSRAQTPASCETDPSFTLLEFWLGSWSVFSGDTLIGTNRITRILHGCAIVEDWTDARGGRGYSLFYFHPASRLWKQVWVTDRALERGGLKEKQLVARLPDGGVRFAGEQVSAEGRRILDRTTLTPEAQDEVRQLIEVSLDGGATWRRTFDARYRRTGRTRPSHSPH